MTGYTQSRVDEIKTRSDLLVFLDEFSKDFRDNPESWDNHSQLRFLEALAAWVQDREGFSKNAGRELPVNPEWKTFAEMLAATTMYE